MIQPMSFGRIFCFYLNYSYFKSVYLIFNFIKVPTEPNSFNTIGFFHL